jgi:hypothetical protein
MIFVHIAGDRKQIEIQKQIGLIGLTIADNGCGRTFIKRIRSRSIADTIRPTICVGDHIEQIVYLSTK